MTKYKKIYDSLILRARYRVIDDYTEKHHITPRCIGGGDEKENIVRLTAREHFIAHQLLIKIYPSEHKLVYAVKMMCVTNKYHHNKRINNRMYEWLKKKYIKTISGTNSINYGKKHSEESKYKMSIAKKGIPRSEETKQKMSNSMKGEKNHLYGKKGEHCHNFGKKLSEETKKKISASSCGENHYMYGKPIEMHSWYGKTHTEVTKNKMSKAQKGEKSSNFNKNWITNIETYENKMISKEEPIPNGWRKGKYQNNENSKNRSGINSVNSGKIWITNIETRENKMISKEELIPNGWAKGRFLKPYKK